MEAQLEAPLETSAEAPVEAQLETPVKAPLERTGFRSLAPTEALREHGSTGCNRDWDDPEGPG